MTGSVLFLQITAPQRQIYSFQIYRTLQNQCIYYNRELLPDRFIGLPITECGSNSEVPLLDIPANKRKDGADALHLQHPLPLIITPPPAPVSAIYPVDSLRIAQKQTVVPNPSREGSHRMENTARVDGIGPSRSLWNNKASRSSEDQSTSVVLIVSVQGEQEEVRG
jgi:hypothetical protein